MSSDTNKKTFNCFLRLTKEAVEDLIEFGVCPRCLLRFCDIGDSNFYGLPEEEIKQYFIQSLGVSFENAPSNDKLCIVCFDILRDKPYCLSEDMEMTYQSKKIHLDESDQQPISDPFTKWIIYQIEHCDHQVDTFSVDVTVSPSLLIRNYTIFSYLVTAYHINDVIYNSVRSLKEGFRLRLIDCFNHYYPSFTYNTEDVCRLTFKFVHPESDQEIYQLPDYEILYSNRCKGKKDSNSQDSITIVQSILNKLNVHSWPETISCPPTPCTTLPEASFVCLRLSVFVTGNYNKYERGLSQTPWMLEGERKTEGSVEEYITDYIKQAYRASEIKFHSAGREDVDVRMVGTGRPFVCELINARQNSLTQEQYQAIQEQINSHTNSIQIHDLRYCSAQGFEAMKAAAEEKKKTYICVVYTSKEMTPERLEALTSYKDLTIYQNTPIRVLHRRTLMVREKMIYSMTPHYINPHHFLCTIEASAGTYIKEFIHGDLGRTQPNMGELLNCEADILQLDVTGVVGVHIE